MPSAPIVLGIVNEGSNRYRVAGVCSAFTTVRAYAGSALTVLKSTVSDPSGYFYMRITTTEATVHLSAVGGGGVAESHFASRALPSNENKPVIYAAAMLNRRRQVIVRGVAKAGSPVSLKNNNDNTQSLGTANANAYGMFEIISSPASYDTITDALSLVVEDTSSQVSSSVERVTKENITSPRVFALITQGEHTMVHAIVESNSTLVTTDTGSVKNEIAIPTTHVAHSARFLARLKSKVIQPKFNNYSFHNVVSRIRNNIPQGSLLHSVDGSLYVNLEDMTNDNPTSTIARAEDALSDPSSSEVTAIAEKLVESFVCVEDTIVPRTRVTKTTVDWANYQNGYPQLIYKHDDTYIVSTNSDQLHVRMSDVNAFSEDKVQVELSSNPFKIHARGREIQVVGGKVLKGAKAMEYLLGGELLATIRGLNEIYTVGSAVYLVNTEDRFPTGKKIDINSNLKCVVCAKEWITVPGRGTFEAHRLKKLGEVGSATALEGDDFADAIRVLRNVRGSRIKKTATVAADDEITEISNYYVRQSTLTVDDSFEIYSLGANTNVGYRYAVEAAEESLTEFSAVEKVSLRKHVAVDQPVVGSEFSYVVDAADETKKLYDLRRLLPVTSLVTGIAGISNKYITYPTSVEEGDAVGSAHVAMDSAAIGARFRIRSNAGSEAVDITQEILDSLKVVRTNHVSMPGAVNANTVADIVKGESTLTYTSESVDRDPREPVLWKKNNGDELVWDNTTVFEFAKEENTISYPADLAENEILTGWDNTLYRATATKAAREPVEIKTLDVLVQNRDGGNFEYGVPYELQALMIAPEDIEENERVTVTANNIPSFSMDSATEVLFVSASRAQKGDPIAIKAPTKIASKDDLTNTLNFVNDYDQEWWVEGIFINDKWLQAMAADPSLLIRTRRMVQHTIDGVEYTFINATLSDRGVSYANGVPFMLHPDDAKRSIVVNGIETTGFQRVLLFEKVDNFYEMVTGETDSGPGFSGTDLSFQWQWTGHAFFKNTGSTTVEKDSDITVTQNGSNKVYKVLNRAETGELFRLYIDSTASVENENLNPREKGIDVLSATSNRIFGRFYWFKKGVTVAEATDPNDLGYVGMHDDYLMHRPDVFATDTSFYQFTPYADRYATDVFGTYGESFWILHGVVDNVAWGASMPFGSRSNIISSSAGRALVLGEASGASAIGSFSGTTDTIVRAGQPGELTIVATGDDEVQEAIDVHCADYGVYHYATVLLDYPFDVTSLMARFTPAVEFVAESDFPMDGNVVSGFSYGDVFDVRFTIDGHVMQTCTVSVVDPSRPFGAGATFRDNGIASPELSDVLASLTDAENLTMTEGTIEATEVTSIVVRDHMGNLSDTVGSIARETGTKWSTNDASGLSTLIDTLSIEMAGVLDPSEMVVEVSDDGRYLALGQPSFAKPFTVDFAETYRSYIHGPRGVRWTKFNPLFERKRVASPADFAKGLQPADQAISWASNSAQINDVFELVQNGLSELVRVTGRTATSVEVIRGYAGTSRRTYSQTSTVRAFKVTEKDHFSDPSFTFPLFHRLNASKWATARDDTVYQHDMGRVLLYEKQGATAGWKLVRTIVPETDTVGNALPVQSTQYELDYNVDRFGKKVYPTASGAFSFMNRRYYTTRFGRAMRFEGSTLHVESDVMAVTPMNFHGCVPLFQIYMVALSSAKKKELGRLSKCSSSSKMTASWARLGFRASSTVDIIDLAADTPSSSSTVSPRQRDWDFYVARGSSSSHMRYARLPHRRMPAKNAAYRASLTGANTTAVAQSWNGSQFAEVFSSGTLGSAPQLAAYDGDVLAVYDGSGDGTVSCWRKTNGGTEKIFSTGSVPGVRQLILGGEGTLIISFVDSEAGNRVEVQEHSMKLLTGAGSSAAVGTLIMSSDSESNLVRYATGSATSIPERELGDVQLTVGDAAYLLPHIRMPGNLAVYASHVGEIGTGSARTVTVEYTTEEGQTATRTVTISDAADEVQVTQPDTVSSSTSLLSQQLLQQLRVTGLATEGLLTRLADAVAPLTAAHAYTEGTFPLGGRVGIPVRYTNSAEDKFSVARRSEPFDGSDGGATVFANMATGEVRVMRGGSQVGNTIEQPEEYDASRNTSDVTGKEWSSKALHFGRFVSISRDGRSVCVAQMPYVALQNGIYRAVVYALENDAWGVRGAPIAIHRPVGTKLLWGRPALSATGYRVAIPHVVVVEDEVAGVRGEKSFRANVYLWNHGSWLLEHEVVLASGSALTLLLTEHPGTVDWADDETFVCGFEVDGTHMLSAITVQGGTASVAGLPAATGQQQRAAISPRISANGMRVACISGTSLCLLEKRAADGWVLLKVLDDDITFSVGGPQARVGLSSDGDVVACNMVLGDDKTYRVATFSEKAQKWYRKHVTEETGEDLVMVSGSSLATIGSADGRTVTVFDDVESTATLADATEVTVVVANAGESSSQIVQGVSVDPDAVFGTVASLSAPTGLFDPVQLFVNSAVPASGYTVVSDTSLVEEGDRLKLPADTDEATLTVSFGEETKTVEVTRAL